MGNNVLVFAVLAVVAFVSAIGVVAFRSPVRSALSLVLTFFTLAMLYFDLGAQLLGISQIMVYAGAIMVLFLFVIMMLKIGGHDKKPEPTDRRLFIAVPLALVMAALILSKFIQPILGTPVTPTTPASDQYGLPQEIGPALFTTYVWPFEVASVLLLVGLVGSILLAKKRS